MYMDYDYAFLRGKKLVYINMYPQPFAIYEGLVETLFTINNATAYSSICSPGYYGLLKQFIDGTEINDVVVVDDLLALCVLKRIEGRTVKYINYTNEYLDILSALNRLIFPTDHVDNEEIPVRKGGLIVSGIPIAFLHAHRIDSLNMKTVMNNPYTNYLFQVGESPRGMSIAQYLSDAIGRSIMYGEVPSSLIDSAFVYIPAVGTKELPKIQGIYQTTISPSSRVKWSVAAERSMFTGTT